MNKILSLLALSALAVTSSAAPPVVSNVTASQRSGTKLVDIYYNLSDADGDAQLIQVQISADGGLTYTIPCVTLSGHIGPGVTPGTGRHIVWNAGADWNGQFVASTKARVTAYDGTTPPPPPGMVYIPAGTFQMGNLNGAPPTRNVYVDTFYMEQTETRGDFYVQVKTWGTNNGYTFQAGYSPGSGRPAAYVRWYDAVKWCNARSEMEGLEPCYYTDATQSVVMRSTNVSLLNSCVKWTASGYRLPTEAEWERAARGGLHDQDFPWGNAINGSYANFRNSGDPYEFDSTDSYQNTTPCGYFNGSQTPSGVNTANLYGLYDMAGNMQELCWDRYDSAYYGTPNSFNNPRGPDTGSRRVVRGGHYYDSSTGSLRVWERNSSNPSGDYYSGTAYFPTNYSGFRCVRRVP